jgi:glycosyltransferase involved in cell wall biosynthesis
MRIGVFLPHAINAVGGAEQATDNLARHLTQRGHRVVVLATGDPAAAEVPYPLHRFKKRFFHRYWPTQIARPLIALHRRERFDAILCAYGEPTGYAAIHAGRKMHVPVVLISHGGDLYRDSVSRRCPRRWARIVYAYRHADALIALSPYMEQLLRELQPRPRLLEEIPNGIDPERVTTPATKPADLCDPRPFCLCLGNFWPAKGFTHAINAFGLVRHQLGDLKMLMVGKGQLEQSLRAQVRSLGLTERVLFLGQRTGNDQRWLLQNCRFGIMPSLEEGHALVGLEYLAAGKPVVCSDLPFFDRGLVHGQNALRVPASDPVAMGRAFMQMHTADLAAMGRASRQQVESFIWPRIVLQYEAFLRKVIRSYRIAAEAQPAFEGTGRSLALSFRSLW